MIAAKNETLERLISDFQLNEATLPENLLALANIDHRYLRDLRVNLGNAFSYAGLSRRESLLLAYSVALNEKNAILTEAFSGLPDAAEATAEEKAEVIALVSLMNANNIIYRFRHFTGKEFYNRNPAGIKMSIMVNPVLGKELFELMSLTVSALNGREVCVKSHEASVPQHGASEQKILDAVRLTAIVKSFTAIM